ncbi:MAG: twin-arginine translocase subunit TatC [Chlorobiaceae bacterium]|nr:twin-arginine translocase subunit TatC [Chlorobiaceae bacterium]MBA4308797.1 twin-arginine translocase subunit TatC [Chlorobiaceae bacterium]
MDAKNKEAENKNSKEELSFLEHLEELRWRVIYSIIGIVVGAIFCAIFIEFIIEGILLKPATENQVILQNLKPFGQIFLYFEVAIMCGIIISIPNIFYQIWKFISPALRQKERKYIFAIVLFSSLCFITGILFAYFLMLPLVLNFAAAFGTDAIKNEFAIDEYMSIVLSVMLGAALIFEMPMVSFFLSKLGILTPQMMRKYRRHSLIGILLLSALLSPGTDPISQIVLAIPLVFLYEISIIVSKYSQKKSEDA